MLLTPVPSRWTAASVRFIVGGVLAVIATIFAVLILFLGLFLGAQRRAYALEAARCAVDLAKELLGIPVSLPADDERLQLPAGDPSSAASRTRRGSPQVTQRRQHPPAREPRSRQSPDPAAIKPAAAAAVSEPKATPQPRWRTSARQRSAGPGGPSSSARRAPVLGRTNTYNTQPPHRVQPRGHPPYDPGQ